MPQDELDVDDFERPRVYGLGARPLVVHAALKHYETAAEYRAALKAAQDLTPVDREVGGSEE